MLTNNQDTLLQKYPNPYRFLTLRSKMGGVSCTILTNNEHILLQNQPNPYRFLTILTVGRPPWSHPKQNIRFGGYRSRRTPIVF